MPKPKADPTKDAIPLAQALARAAVKSGGTKPAAEADDRPGKKNYAQVLSNEAATMFARCLKPRFKKALVNPQQDGSRQEHVLGRGLDRKKTDVSVWDTAAGLMLGISIKTYTFRDPSGTKVNGVFPKVGRYTKNVVRNDMELRAEADVLHRRQPYAVLAAVMLLPLDACYDAGSSANGQSSFAHHVFTLRKRTGRKGVDANRPDLFEKVYVGLFEEDGAVRFFDVEQAPPRRQPPAPSHLLSLAQLIDVLEDETLLRNTGFRAGDDKYASEDDAGTVPEDWLPPTGLDQVQPLTWEDSLEPEGGVDLEDLVDDDPDAQSP